MVYEFKDAARLGRLDAQACGGVLEVLDEQRRLTPSNVVEAARPVSSPLHAGFEWDDASAAEAFRLDQARHILRSIVVVRDEDGQAVPIRAFVTVTGDDGTNDKPQTIYMSLSAALADPVKRDEIVSRARRELHEWMARYKQIKEFAEVFVAIEKTSATQAVA